MTNFGRMQKGLSRSNIIIKYIIVCFCIAEYSATLQFTEEPSDIQFSSKTSAYLHCVAIATSSYASNNQIIITWRFGNGSLVKNISNIVQTLPNGTLWFKPFDKLVPAIHRAEYQCVANLTLHNQGILSRPALVRGGRFYRLLFSSFLRESAVSCNSRGS